MTILGNPPDCSKPIFEVKDRAMKPFGTLTFESVCQQVRTAHGTLCAPVSRLNLRDALALLFVIAKSASNRN